MPEHPARRPRTVAPCPLARVAALLGVPVGAGASPDVAVTGVTLDSRAVRPGDLYAALPGSRTHGALYSGDAAGRGAVAVLTDPPGAPDALACGLPVLVVDEPRARLGEVSAAVYGAPATRLLLLGVTGTNGKTTTTYLLDAALRAAGERTGMVGTVETRVADEVLPSVRTTPEAPDVHALLAVMAERGVGVCSMEVSSHALVLGRVDGLVFDVAAFTNLSQDHLDFHTDMEDYYAAKAQLFTRHRSRRGVVWADSPWGRRIAEEAQVPVVTVGTGAGCDWRVGEVATLDGGARTGFVLTGPDGSRVPSCSPLPGAFNVANGALATVTLLEAGRPEAAAALAALTGVAVPGRMERVPGPPGAPLAVVDYAHGPDAVTTSLRALRPPPPGRVVLVLGAGGDRDRSKRPLMGAAAAAGADVVLVTDDNPRSEDPAQVRAGLLAGAATVAAEDRAEVREVGDRRAAISEAVRLARAGDVVLVAGKGHEQGQEVAGTVQPFDDRVVLAEALRAAAEEGASWSR